MTTPVVFNFFQVIGISSSCCIFDSDKKGIVVFIFVGVAFILPVLIINHALFPVFKIEVILCPEAKQVISGHQEFRFEPPRFNDGLPHDNIRMLNTHFTDVIEHTVCKTCFLRLSAERNQQ